MSNKLRKLILALCIILVASTAWAWSGIMFDTPIFSAETILANGTSTSQGIDLNRHKVIGDFSLQVAVTGTGTCKFEYLMSNDGVTYLEPTSASDIASSITISSGPGSDGKDLYVFFPETARYIKIKCTETGASNSVTVTATLLIQ